MSVGISVYDQTPGELIELAKVMDGTGVDALWLAEHVLSCDHSSVRPTSTRNEAVEDVEHLIDPDVELTDPWVVFGGIAAVTSRLKLATGIHLLPLRHPLITARHMITLQQLSGERFLLGVGGGWLAEEFEALGVPLGGRGKRMDEAIEIVKLAGTGSAFAYGGEVFRFPRVLLSSRPTAMPVIVGGNSMPALRRAARLGDGWFSPGVPSMADALRLRDQIQLLRHEYGKTGDFKIYVRLADTDTELVDRYRAEGIEDLVIWSDRLCDRHVPWDKRLAHLLEVMERFGLDASADQRRSGG